MFTSPSLAGKVGVMQSPKPSIKNAAGACNTNGISRKNLFPNNNTGSGGRKPSPLRGLLDYVLSPIWVCLPRNKGRVVFHKLSFVLGRTKLYSVIGASYLRFLNRKEAA